MIGSLRVNCEEVKSICESITDVKYDQRNTNSVVNLKMYYLLHKLTVPCIYCNWMAARCNRMHESLKQVTKLKWMHKSTRGPLLKPNNSKCSHPSDQTNQPPTATTTANPMPLVPWYKNIYNPRYPVTRQPSPSKPDIPLRWMFYAKNNIFVIENPSLAEIKIQINFAPLTRWLSM